METRTNTFPDLVVVAHEKGKESTPESGLKRRVLAYNDKLFSCRTRDGEGLGWNGARTSARSNCICRARPYPGHLSAKHV